MKYSETFTSVGKTHVNFDVYIPNVMIRYKAIIQIHHAMSEYSGRYQRFAEYLVHNGFVVVVSDFPGHGSSLYNYEQGYFGEGDATEILVKDMHRLRNIMAKRFPDLPYFMLGNQLGSLVLRKYVSEYGDYVQGCILMGTCGKCKFLNIGKMLLRSERIFKGEMHRSKVFKKRLVSNYENMTKTKKYLTSVTSEIEQYQQDPFTDFVYTNKAYCEILNLIKEASLDDTIKKTPDYLSLYIISGTNDPFGYLGEGPKWLYDKFVQKGIRDLSFKLYENSYQDILHDCQRLEVYNDILTWLNERTYV